MTTEELKDLRTRVLEAINRELQPTRMTDEELLKAITSLVDRESRGDYLLPIQKMDTVNSIYKMYRGLGGLLDSILADEDITEVMINGPDNIFVERKGRLTRVDKHFKDEQELRRVIDLIVGKAHREVSEANPIVDTRLEDGSRVNVVLSPIALSGSTVTIRKFSKQPMTMEKLLEYGSITPEVAQFLQKLVKARYNIFIAGGTGSGKTTFLNALSSYIPHDERIITIEDSAELQITQIPNIVRLETRNATASSGESKKIDIQSLIRSSLRMRPDRIIVGEVRGAEALDMLQAMNTGHDGSLSTGHANSAEDMLSRLETMVLQGEAALPLKAIRQQLYYEDGDYDSVVRTLKQADAAKIPFNDAMMQYWNEAYYACNVSNSSYLSVQLAGMDGVYLGWDGEKNVLFSSADGELLDRDYVFVGPVGQSTVVLCSDEKGESFAFQLSQNLMVGRFMAEIEEGNGYGDGLFPVKLKGRSDWSYIDINGTEYLNGYQMAGMFQNGKAPVRTQNGEWIFVDQSGAQQGSSYEEIQLSENGSWLVGGVFLAKENGVWNFYSESGEKQGALDADAVDLNRGSGLAFCKNGKWGFATNDGNVAIEPEYDKAKSFSGGVAAVCTDGKWGFINGNGTLVIDHLLADASYFDANGVCPARVLDSDVQQMLSWRVERS